MSPDFHSASFDESTLVKLGLFRRYLGQWCYVFLRAGHPIWQTVNIYDFFAGPGKDLSGAKGSPLLILDSLYPHAQAIRSSKLDVRVVFNEIRKRKFTALKRTIDGGYGADLPIQVEVLNEDFADAFRLKVGEMRNSANLLFFDQTGMKYITDDTFVQVMNLQATDFVFFISSSFVRRFADHDSFRSHVNFSKAEIMRRPYFHSHRAIVSYYRSLIPRGKTYYVGGYSIKKGSNIYGLVFGTGHHLGMEKWLRSSWEMDPVRGEANFDIDADNLDPNQKSLFPDMDRPEKIVRFENAIRLAIESEQLRTDAEVYLYTLQEGCLPTHAREVIRQLKNDGVLSAGHLRISKDAVREPRGLRMVRHG